MDYLPPDLSEDECAALDALALRKALPAALTPSQLVALSYPAANAWRERRTLLHAVCAALADDSLRPASPVKRLEDLPKQIAVRWQGAAPPFNPTVTLHNFFDPYKSAAEEEMERGEPIPDFDVPIRREDFLAWSRTLPLHLPGYAALRTRAPDEVDMARPFSVNEIPSDAELNRLPTWLRRKEIFLLWYPEHQRKADRAIQVRCKAHDKLFSEDVASGKLKNFQTKAEQISPAKPQRLRSSSGFVVDERRNERPWIPDFEKDWISIDSQPESTPSIVTTTWIHRDDMEAWLRFRKIELPEWALLRRWFPSEANDEAVASAVVDEELSRKRSGYGLAAQENRSIKDWRPLIAEGQLLMLPNGTLSASDAARKVARKHKLTGANAPTLSGQTKTLANKLTEGGRRKRQAD